MLAGTKKKRWGRIRMFRKWLWSAAPLALAIGSAAQSEPANQSGTQQVAASAAASSTRSATPPAQASAAELETLVVTASRREISIRETPVAVSSYSGPALAAAHVLSLVDLVPSSPNIQLGALQTNQDIHIRGIGDSLLNAGSDPGVAFHQDGVYLAETGLATSAFLDINRVEVLRGPQGTLFGRNATGGAVNVIPNIPTHDLSYGLDASLGFSPTEDHVAGFISGPLASNNTLLGRLAVQQTYNEGFTKNLTTGGPSGLDGANNYSGRGQLMWLPTSAFSARLSLEFQHEKDDGPAAYDLGSADPTVVLPPSLEGPPDGLDKREVYARVGEKKFDGFGASLFTDWSVGGGDLKGTFAYNNTRETFINDSGTRDPFTPIATTQNANEEFAELIYASDPQYPLTFVLGANYVHSREFQQKNVTVPFLPFPIQVGGTIGTGSYAAFAHAQYAFNFGLKLFAGVRETHDSKHLDEFLNLVGSLSQHHSWKQPTFEVGATYDFSPAVTGYVKYATGYKSGGYSAGSLTPAFDPETDKLVEAGLKGSYFGGALQANLAVFHTDYDNLQVNQVVQFIVQTKNAARATIKGFELETVERITPSLRFEISGGYLDAKFNQFTTEDSARPSLGELNLAGNTLPLAPKATVSAAGFYDIPIAAPGKLTASAEYNWKSRVYFTEFNIPIASQPAVGKLNLNLNYQSVDQKWSAGIYARNVTNEIVKSDVIVTSAVVSSLALGYLDPGREVGVSFHYRY
jgi:iron complex outermembrane receptor protein